MKKPFVLGLAILFVAGLAMTACPRDIDTAPIGLPDFSVKVTLDKTEARVGDTVTATVVFRNLRGGDIEAELPGWIAERGGQGKEDILDVVFLLARDFNCVFPWDDPHMIFEPRPKILIAREEVIKRKFEHIITVPEDLLVRAGAFFFTACSHLDGLGIQATSDLLKITVIKEQ